MFEMGGESRYHQISRIRLDGASAHDWVSTTSGSAPFAIPTREANSWIERCLWNPLLSFAGHRLPLFVCALLVPEYILAWAIRQFLGARKIAKDNKSEFKTLGHIVTILSN